MKIVSHSVAQTLALGKTIARHLLPGDIICLFGELGSGKTVLAKGIALGLGIKQDSVTSPTFVLLKQFTQGKIPLYHFDLYRLKEAQDILNLGYEEYLYGGGASVIEWAGRLGKLLPKEYLKVNLKVGSSTTRHLNFEPVGGRYRELAAALVKDLR